MGAMAGTYKAISHIGVAWRLCVSVSLWCWPWPRDNSLSNAACDGLDPPSLGVVDTAGLPEDVRGDDPCPKELPEYRGPPCKRESVHVAMRGGVCLPFPALSDLRLSVLLGAGMNLCAGNTP